MLRKHFIVSLMATFIAFPAFAAPEFVKARINNALEVGSSRFTYMFWDVYDISLYAAHGKWDKTRTFALSLSYLRDLEGKAIAERSAEEIRTIGFTDEVRLAAWFSEMNRIFPDVTENSMLTGIYVPNAPTIFFLDGKAIGTIQDPEFGAWFFNIWLSPNTSQPTLRRKLLRLS